MSPLLIFLLLHGIFFLFALLSLSPSCKRGYAFDFDSEKMLQQKN